MSVHRDFKGVWIPKEIWLNKELTIMEKLFVVEIDSLDNEDGCYASNKHFAKFFGVSRGRCTQIIKQLEAKNYVSIDLERDGKVISKRVVRILNTLVKKLNTPSENIKHGYLENAQESNTVINNTENNIYIDAFGFLKLKHPSTATSLMMQFKSKINDWDYLVTSFNSICDKEDLEYKERILRGRFVGYANTWIRNAANAEKTLNKNESDNNRLANQHLQNAI